MTVHKGNVWGHGNALHLGLGMAAEYLVGNYSSSYTIKTGDSTYVNRISMEIRTRTPPALVSLPQAPF